jgi:hypothetical protein
VLRKGCPAEGEGQDQAGKDWSEAEVGLIVADYFDMLRSDLLGLAYSKAAHRIALRPRLPGRSDGTVQFKHQNISAVLVGLGLPYVKGYKPRGNLCSLDSLHPDRLRCDRCGWETPVTLDPWDDPESLRLLTEDEAAAYWPGWRRTCACTVWLSGRVVRRPADGGRDGGAVVRWPTGAGQD